MLHDWKNNRLIILNKNCRDKSRRNLKSESVWISNGGKEGRCEMFHSHELSKTGLLALKYGQFLNGCDYLGRNLRFYHSETNLKKLCFY